MMGRRRETPQRGSLSAFVVCTTMTMLCLTGLVYDGGRVVAAYVDVSDAAAGAARMGDQFVVGIRDGDPRIDKEAGARAVARYLGSKRLSGDVEVSGRLVTVRVTRRVPMLLLSIVGYSHRDISVVRSSVIVDG